MVMAEVPVSLKKHQTLLFRNIDKLFKYLLLMHDYGVL